MNVSILLNNWIVIMNKLTMKELLIAGTEFICVLGCGASIVIACMVFVSFIK